MVTPLSLVMMVHQGDNREMRTSRDTRGKVAGSSFPMMLPSESGGREIDVAKPRVTCKHKGIVILKGTSDADR